MSALPVVGADDAGAERGGDEAADRDGAVPGGPDWVPRVVALDLDGTVVENDGTVARPDVVAAVEIALAAGAHVLIATGRAVSSTLDVAASLGIGDAQLVCSNGAVVFDGRTGAATFQATFDPGPPVRSLTEHLPGVHFAVEVGLEGFRTTEGFLRDFPGVYLGVVELDELVLDPTVRLIARGPDGHDLAQVRRAGERSLGDAYGWWTGHSSWIDVTVRGVSKATGVARAAESLGFDAADVLAVGDGWNDVELLAWAGWGVAMGHAPPGVRDVADAVTGRVADGGAAEIIRRFFPA